MTKAHRSDLIPSKAHLSTTSPVKNPLIAAVCIATSMLMISGSRKGESDGTFAVTVEKQTARRVAKPPHIFQGIVP